MRSRFERSRLRKPKLIGMIFGIDGRPQLNKFVNK